MIHHLQDFAGPLSPKNLYAIPENGLAFEVGAVHYVSLQKNTVGKCSLWKSFKSGRRLDVVLSGFF